MSSLRPTTVSNLQTADMSETKSLFVKMGDRRKALGMGSQLHRLILLVRLTPPKPDGGRGASFGDKNAGRREFIVNFEEHAKQWRDGRRGDVLSGTIIHYHDYVLLVMECTVETLYMAMSDIQQDVDQGKLCNAAKIISFGSGIACRLFREWSSRVLPLLHTNVQEDITAEPLSRNLPMLIEAILKFSTRLSTFPRVDLAMHMDRLRENFSHIMIPKDHFDYLISQDDISSISTYMERYRGRQEIFNENERTQPAQALVGPPTETLS